MPSEDRPGRPEELVLRPASPEDADALTALFLDARRASYPAIPLPVHPPEDVRRWLGSRLEPGPGSEDVEVWLAEGVDGRPAALLLLEGSWVHSLYVDPALTGHGIGTALLGLAQSLRPDGLGLWVFETNEAAQRFYRRHGFGEVRRTDGTDNEEQQPDIEMAWPDPGSVDGLRRSIDRIDDRLAGLLGERARLTARVQQLKEVPGHAGRDLERESQIVARMARLAPDLGEDRIRRIMHQVISESLDAAAGPDPDPEQE